MAGILGALLPDVDAVLMPFGWDIYLRAHEIGTHSLAGSLPIAGSAALIARAFARDTPVFDLFAAAWLGCLSHIALDVLSGARIQIGWPLVPGRVSLPLVAMGEPWLLALFVTGAVALTMSRRRPRATAVALVAGAAAFLGVKAVLLAQALPSDRTVDHDPSLTRIVEARWGSLTKWVVFDRRADMLTQRQVEAGRPPVPLLTWPIVPDSPLVRDSRSLEAVRNFLDVHELAFAGEVAAANGGRQVLWSDLRFCWRPLGGDGETSPELVLTVNTPTGPASIACALWVGGAFDQSGRVITQLVRVGRWWQTRAPKR
jgi:membrane-bound metal-dependent hydrolase YbcI (DUF457 family)